jgi:hypothetical protein
VITTWYEKVQEFESPTRVIAAVLLRSRETQVAQVCELSQRLTELESQLDQQQQEISVRPRRAANLQAGYRLGISTTG